ncbi:MAG TPA: choice-of-anchor D domain-containing protein [Terriglobia bacterium]|nr:choice-of-anchor D domain-containing protein [Terriglobia bacterium]
MKYQWGLGSIFGGPALAAVLMLAMGSWVRAQNCFTVSPSNLQINFANVAVGTRSAQVQPITITNVSCPSSITITTFSLSPGEFQLDYGFAPLTIYKGHGMQYGISFVPDSAQNFQGTFTVTVQGYSPVVVTLSGAGFTTGAATSISPSSLTFTNLRVGNRHFPQTVTYTNTGTSPLQVKSVYAEPPFSIEGFTQPVVLQPGHSLPVQVEFLPTYVGSYTGALVMTSDVLPPKTVPLTATAIATTPLSITTFPVLPSGTAGFAYLTTLLAAGGTAPYSWSLATGANLPQGLSLSSSGTITGTMSAGTQVGNHRVTVEVTDSSTPPNTTTSVLSLPVAAPNGAECNNIIFDVPGTNNPIVPINDLGAGYYQGAEGGLYLNGSNIMPASHDADGVNFAQSIQPLDANGNPDPNGKIGLLSVGLSVTFDTFGQFIQAGVGDPSLNSHLVFVPGAQPRLGAPYFANPGGAGWSAIMDYFLPQSGVTANQVQAVWFEDIDAGPNGTFPGDMTTLESQYISIAQNLHTFFPNLKLAYFSTRFYSGYSNGLPVSPDPETYAYETGFAVQAVIQDQINGDPALNYNPASGPVLAPWIAWGPYDWANGMLARSDGLVWPCSDFEPNGTHLVDAAKQAEASILLNFFKTTDTTLPWFLVPTQSLAHRARPFRPRKGR